MNLYAIYDQDGAILRTTSCPEEMVEGQALPGESILPVDREYSSRLYKVVDRAIVEKDHLPYRLNKSSIVADGEDEIVIDEFPNGAWVTWPDGEQTVLEDNEPVIFSVDLEGRHVFKFEHKLYLETEVVVEAHAEAQP